MDTQTATKKEYTREQLGTIIRQQQLQIDNYKNDLQEATQYMNELEMRAESQDQVIKNLEHQLNRAISGKDPVNVDLNSIPEEFGETLDERINKYMYYLHQGVMFTSTCGTTTKKTTTRKTKTTTPKTENE